MSVGQQRLKPHAAVSIALVVLLHVALLWLATAPSPTPAARDNRVWLQLLRPAPARIPKLVAEQRSVSPQPPAKRLQDRPSPSSTAPQHAPAAVQATPDSIKHRPDELALLEPTSAPEAPPDVVQLSLKAVAAIDRQLRSEHKQEYSAPPDTVRARLVKGISAAHAAAKPKLFEPARTELISAPNDPKRIYRVTTALGEYCLYYPDKASISANSAASAGLAGFGQPTAASCPIPF